MYLSTYTSLLLSLTTLASSEILHTSSRWIVNSQNEHVKLRCVNWAGHSEPNIPEGLNMQSLDYITSWVANAGFNCVRLTYSIDMALNPNQLVSDSFDVAANTTGKGSELTDVYTEAVAKNSFLATATVLGTYEKVVESLGKNNIKVILDNHNSRAGWCCSTSDGNGWWKEASGYDPTNSRYFITADWLTGLSNMATWGKNYDNVVGLSLRNELRAVGNQGGNGEEDWYDLSHAGAEAIHNADPDALIIVGGTSYALVLGFLKDKPFDRSQFGDKVVWEFHSYSWSSSNTGNCPLYTEFIEENAGFLLEEGKEYTGPLWLSEFGWNQDAPNDLENKYTDCLSGWMAEKEAGWAYWALQGSYYYREGEVNYDETFGVLKKDWSDWRNPNFREKIGGMWDN